MHHNWKICYSFKKKDGSLLEEDQKIKNYLMCLGIVKNTIIKIQKKSIFNGPIIIEIRGYNLCISNNISNNIVVDCI